MHMLVRRVTAAGPRTEFLRVSHAEDIPRTVDRHRRDGADEIAVVDPAKLSERRPCA